MRKEHWVKSGGDFVRNTAIPAPEQHWPWLRCPRCGRRIWNQLFTTMLAYRVHYQSHIIDDLSHDLTVVVKGGDPRPWPR